MLDKFWESVGVNLANKWLEYIFGPALIFWAGGLSLCVYRIGWPVAFQTITSLTQFQQGIAIFLLLFVLAFSSSLVLSVRYPYLQLLQGYWPWPFNYLGFGIIALWKPVFIRKYSELRRLKTLEDLGKLDFRSREKLVRLEAWAHLLPPKASDQLPTTFGNVMRARERTPETRYGLDAVVCWPRLWFLLPENVRTDISNARLSLDRLVVSSLWGYFFLVWAFCTPWAILISVVWIFATYRMVIQEGMSYGDLIEAAFDLYRLSLYDALKWSRPNSSADEKELGKKLTEYLWRGTLSKPLKYKVDGVRQNHRK